MKTVTIEISDPARDVLQHGVRITGNALVITRQLDRELYLEVNKVLANLGGKWNRGKKAHIFDRDPTLAMAPVLDTGEVVDIRKTFQFFPTPPAAAARMAELLGARWGDRILEPSAGDGALCEAVLLESRAAIWQITAVEVDPVRIKNLQDKGYKPIQEDFMSWSAPYGDPDTVFADTPQRFDRIIMNPPFSNRADVHHVSRALDMLRPGGRIVAMMAAGALNRNDRLSQGLAARLHAMEDSIMEDLPRETYDGINVMVVAATLELT